MRRAVRAAVPRTILLLAEWDDLEMHRLGFDRFHIEVARAIAPVVGGIVSEAGDN